MKQNSSVFEIKIEWNRSKIFENMSNGYSEKSKKVRVSYNKITYFDLLIFWVLPLNEMKWKFQTY